MFNTRIKNTKYVYEFYKNMNCNPKMTAVETSIVTSSNLVIRKYLCNTLNTKTR